MSEDIVRKLAEAAKNPAPQVDPHKMLSAITKAMDEEMKRQDPKGIGDMNPEGVMKAIVALPATVLNAVVESHIAADLPLSQAEFDATCEGIILRVAESLSVLRAILIDKEAFR